MINTGELTSKGVELELAAAVARGLNVSLSGSFTDAKLTKAGLAFDAKEGDRAPNVPRWNWSLSADYRRPIAKGDIFISGAVTYTGKSYSDFESVSSARIVPDSTSLDMFLGYETEAWTISLFGKNLTDELIVTAVDTDRRTPLTYSVARPRTLGINLKRRF